MSQELILEPLNHFVAPILPFGKDAEGPDAPGTYKSDTITVLHVERGAAQTTIAQPLLAQDGFSPGEFWSWLPAGDPNCGFAIGMRVLVFDDTGAYDAFTISNIDAFGLNLQHNMRDSAKTYTSERFSHRPGGDSHAVFEGRPCEQHVSIDAIRRCRRCGRPGCRSRCRPLIRVFWRSAATADAQAAFRHGRSVDDVRTEASGRRRQLRVRRKRLAHTSGPASST